MCGIMVWVLRLWLFSFSLDFFKCKMICLHDLPRYGYFAFTYSGLWAQVQLLSDLTAQAIDIKIASRCLPDSK